MGDHMDDPESWKFKRARDGDKHIKACTTGFRAKSSATENVVEVHHILCVHACSDETFPKCSAEHKKFIYKCFETTTWDINAGANNIGLPRKWAYVKDVKNTTGWGGLPCHQVDHDLYLTSVMDHVTTKIWNSLLKGKKAEDCKKMTGENIAKYFNDGSDHWRSHLVNRGSGSESEGKGTKEMLDYCLGGTIDADLELLWYVPFSMAEAGDIRERTKPPKGNKVERAGLLAAVT